jgi:hypothetical protein
MPVATAWELARAWYADRLAPSWTRPAVPEMRALFTRLGLGGPAWELTG